MVVRENVAVSADQDTGSEAGLNAFSRYLGPTKKLLKQRVIQEWVKASFDGASAALSELSHCNSRTN